MELIFELVKIAKYKRHSQSRKIAGLKVKLVQLMNVVLFQIEENVYFAWKKYF